MLDTNLYGNPLKNKRTLDCIARGQRAEEHLIMSTRGHWSGWIGPEGDANPTSPASRLKTNTLKEHPAIGEMDEAFNPRIRNHREADFRC